MAHRYHRRGQSASRNIYCDLLVLYFFLHQYRAARIKDVEASAKSWLNTYFLSFQTALLFFTTKVCLEYCSLSHYFLLIVRKGQTTQSDNLHITIRYKLHHRCLAMHGRISRDKSSNEFWTYVRTWSERPSCNV